MTGRRQRSRSRTPSRGRHVGYTHHSELHAKSDVETRHSRQEGTTRERSSSPRRSRKRQDSPDSKRYHSEKGGHSITSAIPQSHSRSRSPERNKHSSKHKKHRDRSSSGSAPENEKRSKHEHRHKHRDRCKSPKRHRKHRKEKTMAVTAQWGKYGIINESDVYNKEEEFKTWLVEECKVNPETLSKDQTKKHFARYMEDYNTATLPHEKFYNMKRYESRMNLLRNGELLPQGDEDTYDFNADYRAHSSALKHNTTSQTQSYLTTEKLKELRQVERERVELIKRKQLGLEVSATLGVRMDGHSVEEPLDM